MPPPARRRSAYLLVASVLILAALGHLPASAQQAPAGPPAAPTQDTRSLDFVAAMVGSKAILASQVTELWRDGLRDDAARAPALRQYTSAAKRHALWSRLLEALVAREITAQSARLMGRSPDEVEQHVQRLVQEEITRRAEDAGGLNTFSRKLGAIGRSMGTETEDLRADFLRSMAYYQGVLRELHDQKAMLATPKAMKELFDANPTRFDRPGSAKLAAIRFARDTDPSKAQTQAEATAAAWRQLVPPVTEAKMRELGAHVLDVALDEGTPALSAFARGCKAGEVSPPTNDEGWIWVMLCLSRIETERATFADAAVQQKLRDEIAARRWDQIAGRLFPEDRVGVRRLPWGEPAAMERGRRTEPR